MRKFLAVLIASLAAALAPAIVVTCFFFFLDSENPNPIWPVVFLVAVIVAFVHTLVFGLVTAGWLLRTSNFRVVPMLLAGSIIGIIPAAIWQHPFQNVGTQSSSWAGGVQTLDNGVTTLAGWIDYLQYIGCAGILGAMGAMAFYFTYKGMSPNNSFKPSPHQGGA